MLNRICLACGKKYEYCGSCPTSTNLPVWKNIFDSENCKIIFENVSDYAQGTITKEAAKDRISKCDFSMKYKDNIQKYIDDIMAEPKDETIIEKIKNEDVTVQTKMIKNKIKNKTNN